MRPSRPDHAPVTVPLSETERLFILYRLRNVTETVEAILHRDANPAQAPKWPRRHLVESAWCLIRVLRHKPHVVVVSAAHRALLAETIEGNTYFVRPPDDPLLNAVAIGIADALRRKLGKAVGRKLRRCRTGL